MARNPYTGPPLRYREIWPEIPLPDPRTRPVQGPWTQNASQMTKLVQNGPKMVQNGPCGPLGPAKGHFGSFWGHFGAQVLTKLTNVPYNAQMEAFTASFCAMLAGF